MDGTRGGEYYISKPRWSSGKIYGTPLATEFEPEEKHFASENFAGFSLCILSEGSAKLRWVGRRVRRSSVGCSVAQKGAA